MNEFVAKKLGEVLAFAEVGKETWEMGTTALESVFGADYVSKTISENVAHAEALREIAEENNVQDIVLKKLEGTGKKLRDMRELYVGDQWDNPTELLEWSGFFEGAAVVHWALVNGASEVLSHDDLITLSKTGKDFHSNLLNIAETKLKEVGAKKAV